MAIVTRTMVLRFRAACDPDSQTVQGGAGVAGRLQSVYVAVCRPTSMHSTSLCCQYSDGSSVI